nr:fibronectin type III domain-containing protein [Kofleriaceae bacterium]
MVAALCLPVAASGDAGSCHVVKVDFTPQSNQFEPQIVAWIEDSAGTFVTTAFITQQTGRYGLGNRPGRYDFNSGPMWPYGHRVNTFPVWAHRHGQTFPAVRFQSDDEGDPHTCCGSDDDLSHDRAVSSTEGYYCPPELPKNYPMDAVTCASAAFTDKGVFDSANTSLYPPRADLGAAADTADSPSAAMYQHMDMFDAISQATPPGGTPYEIKWPIPSTLADGTYVLFLEVSREFDQNDTYSVLSYPSPKVAYGDYGSAYRGQPSVVYKVPFTIATHDTTTSVTDYAGYGDIDGATGTLHPPDATITTAVDRLQLVSGGSGSDGMYRVLVVAHSETDLVPPGAVRTIAVDPTSAATATLTFVEPGDDGFGSGAVSSYEIRVRAGQTIDDSNFEASTPIAASAVPVAPGDQETVDLTGLLPSTQYSLGVRALDDCGNTGPLVVTSFTTPDRQSGEVDACFVATAAYGSLMANDVEVLRRFRDMALRKSVLGELFVESYYTFGPPVAGVVGESELLRQTARDALTPLVRKVREGGL